MILSKRFLLSKKLLLSKPPIIKISGGQRRGQRGSRGDKTIARERVREYKCRKESRRGKKKENGKGGQGGIRAKTSEYLVGGGQCIPG